MINFTFKNKNIQINDSEQMTLYSYDEICEIPILPHPGAFSKVRKNHVHEGVDLYCRYLEPVYSMAEGEIVAIQQFTGHCMNSPWWNDTYCVMVKSLSEDFSICINYGEIMPLPSLSIGHKVTSSQLIGHVIPVLKKDKGRPMNMLHLEFYHHDVSKPIYQWKIGEAKPMQLLDPTQTLLSFLP